MRRRPEESVPESPRQKHIGNEMSSCAWVYSGERKRTRTRTRTRTRSRRRGEATIETTGWRSRGRRTYHDPAWGLKNVTPASSSAGTATSLRQVVGLHEPPRNTCFPMAFLEPAVPFRAYRRHQKRPLLSTKEMCTHICRVQGMNGHYTARALCATPALSPSLPPVPVIRLTYVPLTIPTV